MGSISVQRRERGGVERLDPASGVVEGFTAPDHLWDDEPEQCFADAAPELLLEERVGRGQEGNLPYVQNRAARR